MARIWMVARTDVETRRLVIKAGLPVGTTLRATVEPQTWARILSLPETLSDAVLALMERPLMWSPPIDRGAARRDRSEIDVRVVVSGLIESALGIDAGVTRVLRRPLQASQIARAIDAVVALASRSGARAAPALRGGVGQVAGPPGCAPSADGVRSPARFGHAFRSVAEWPGALHWKAPPILHAAAVHRAFIAGEISDENAIVRGRIVAGR